VALWVGNRVDTWMTVFIACTRIGALVLNLNPRFRETEMEHFLKVSDPDLVVLENGLLGVDYARMAMETAPNGGKKMAILNLGTTKGMPDTSKYPRPVRNLPLYFSFDCPDPVPELADHARGTVDSPAVCFSTSGLFRLCGIKIQTSVADFDWFRDLRHNRAKQTRNAQTIERCP